MDRHGALYMFGKIKTCGQDFTFRKLPSPSFALPGRGSGKGSACCCKGRPGEDITLPQVSFDQDESNLFYMVEFESEMHQSWWSVGVFERQCLMIKAVVHPPDVWFSHIKLKEPLEDECITTQFENDCRKIIITMVRPDDTRWRMLGTPQPQDNRIMPSVQAPLDFYPATIILKKEIAPGYYLFAIKTGCEYQYSVPVAWHMMIKIGDIYKPYTPIKFLTKQEESRYSTLEQTKRLSGSTVSHFLIRIRPEGELTSQLDSMAVDVQNNLELGCVIGRFDTDWLYQTDRLLIFAGGSGIAPWTSLIKFIRDKQSTFQVRQVVLFLSCRVSAVEEIIWHSVWESLSLLDWFFYVPYATLANEGEDPKRFTFASVTSDLEQISIPEGAKVPLKIRGVACGPMGFTDSCHGILKKLNIDEEDIILFNG